MITVYGIKNCNTVKSALDWLKSHQVAYDFHDYKTKGIDEQRLRQWEKQVGWEKLVNKRGTTWRQLDESTQQSVKDAASAIQLMIEKTSVIKRPLIERDGQVIVLGFDGDEYAEAFS